jgi:kinesin family protein 5
VGAPIVESVFEGFNGSILVYGQTSSGKTHTMLGGPGQQGQGLVSRMSAEVFARIRKSPEHMEFQIKLSVCEIYNEKVRDLLDLAKKDLKVREDFKKNVFIEDLTERYAGAEEEVEGLLQAAITNRATGSTNINERSSRSHMLVLLTLHQKDLREKTARTGKLCLADLAGSERVSKTGAVGEQLREAKKINASLIVLGKVINALIDKSPYLPYRESKLTRILQESLGGNSRTALVVTCSPHPSNLPETLSTLRFGISARKVKNRVKQNKEFTPEELMLIIERTQRLLDAATRRLRALEGYVTQDLGARLPPDLECGPEAGPSLEEQQADSLRLVEAELALYKHNEARLAAEAAALQERNDLLEAQAELLRKRVQELELEAEGLRAVQREGAEETSSEASLGLKRLEEMQLQVKQERVRTLHAEEKLSRMERDVKKKLLTLEGNIRALTENYYELARLKSHWKTEYLLCEKRLALKTRELNELQGADWPEDDAEPGDRPGCIPKTLRGGRKG